MYERSKEAVAKRLKALMDAYEIRTQKELCDMIEESPSKVNQYLRAVHYPRIETASKICDKFNVTLDWIFHGKTGGLSVGLSKSLDEHSDETTA
ncbi:helix-turn-helix transcriptional regulator [Nisaea nitritireducens]|uniref:helix-turn-helix transcriptional regulator n=1 Tax=Nisaea nitritireducens TaxID=568392 RepID=UPI00186849EC|nr:helix-turn-helix transcriptional regulator [Nisaea nitritireducens]